MQVLERAKKLNETYAGFLIDMLLETRDFIVYRMIILLKEIVFCKVKWSKHNAERFGYKIK